MLADTFLALSSLIAFREIHAPTTVAWQPLPVARYAPGPKAPSLKQDSTFSYGVETTAHAAIVMDVASGEPLYEKDADTAYPIASLTKLMTAMTVLDLKADMNEGVTLGREDDPHVGALPLPLGETFTREELMNALLVGSANIAGNALARSLGGEDFIKAMNAKARSLGLSQAVFYEPTGLDSRNQASARDVAKIVRAALNYPEIRRITEQSSTEVAAASGKSYTVKTTNMLLSSYLNKKPYEIMLGKTGSLNEAGFCLTIAVRDAQGHEVITVGLGSNNHFSRFQDVKALTAWTFEHYEWPMSTAAR